MTAPDPILIQVNGLYWPLSDIHAREVITRDCAPAIAQLLSHFDGRDCIVQAGGNCGVYPIALADLFDKVITAEPDRVNLDCLARNVSAHDTQRRVHIVDGAFGAEAGRCMPLEVEPNNCGAHRVAFVENGPVRVVTIDGLGLEACDCIWADVEGSELHLLRGAEKTIERFSPIIACEDKGLHRAFDIPDGALQAWLAERGYEQIDKIGNDKVFRRT